MGDDSARPVKPQWTLNGAIKEADAYTEELGLPRTARPSGWGTEYEFPSDLTQLSSVELGRWQSQMERLWAYALQVSGREESELGEYENLFDIKLGLRTHEEAGKIQGKVPVKEVMKALAIESDPDLKSLLQTVIARRLRSRRLGIQTEIYRSHLQRLSREQSRREAEARIN